MPLQPTRERGVYILVPKKKSTPPTKPKGVIIGAPAAPTMFISEEEEPISRADIILASASVPVGKLT